MSFSNSSDHDSLHGEAEKHQHERNQSITSTTTDEQDTNQDLNALENGDPATNVSTGPPFSVFDRRTRIFIITMVAFSALISPFAATLYFPALTPLAEQLHVSNSLINLTITTYMASSIPVIRE
jgi:Ca2+/Na+ antiporter